MSVHMARELPPISSGDIRDLQAAIENAEPGDVIYITKDLTLHLDDYETALPTLTTSGFGNSIPFSIIGQPSASKGPNAKIHIGSAGKRLKVPLVGGNRTGWYDTAFFASVTFENISLHMTLSPTEHFFGGYVCLGENNVFVNCDAEGSIVNDSVDIGYISPFIGDSWGTLYMNHCTNNCKVSLPSCRYIGGLVGSIGGDTNTIVSCVNNGSIRGFNQLGGIASGIYCDNLYMENCVNKGDIDAVYVEGGGIAGFIWCEINCIVKNCYNSGTITTQTTSITDGWVGLGGIVGSIEMGAPNAGVYSCVNYGDVVGRGVLKRLGGIVGSLWVGEVMDCVNYGSVRNGGMIGGIVGCATSGVYQGSINPSLIKRCVNKGNVYGTSHGVGGIAGCLYGDVTVEDCRVCGMVDTVDTVVTIEANSQEVGGIVGMVQLDVDIAWTDISYEATTIIRNNLASAGLIKVNNASLADNGLDYVHRILGRFLPDQLNPDPLVPPNVGDKFLLLENNYAFPSLKLVGNNSKILEGYELDHFYNIQKGGVYPKPGVTVQHSDPDYGANRLNGANANEIDPAYPLAKIMFACMYPINVVIPARLTCGGDRGKYPAGCMTVGLYRPDGKTLLATATNDENGRMKLTVPESVFIGFGKYCFLVKRMRTSRNWLTNYTETFPVYVYISRNSKGGATSSICYSMMLGDPNFTA
ncbi:hypothetical protein AGMMS49992_20670 [Clostridia bacterium]|nr:hypothetical protein AGMMS49992_20670 [Clostridia bacterium]